MVWAPDYVTVAELKAFQRIGDSADDAQLALAVTAASRAIDKHTNRQFGVVAAVEERFYTAVYDRHRGRWVIEIDDLMSAVGLLVTVRGGLEVDVFATQPANAAANGRPWTRLVVAPESGVMPDDDEDGVSVTALWGWTAVPTTIKQAALLQASRFFTRRDAPFGVAGSPELGSELRLLAKVDPDVAVALGPYYRWWAVR